MMYDKTRLSCTIDIVEHTNSVIKRGNYEATDCIGYTRRYREREGLG